MTIKLALAASAVVFATPLAAQSFGPLGEQTPNWIVNPTRGIPGNTVAGKTEVFTTAQGSVPPAIAYEPADIDEAGHYTRTQWIQNDNIDRQDAGEAKFRTNCNVAKFGNYDPIIGYNMEMFGHHHTFIGNLGVTANSDYASLRAAPASSCAGGPLNGTAYWEPTLMYEPTANVLIPLKPNIVTFYYTVGSYVGTDKRVRLFNNQAFIGGVNPRDRANAFKFAEIPSTGFNVPTNNPGLLDGWFGWQCYKKSGTGAGVSVAATGPGVYPALSSNFTRNLVNPDGSDPFSGGCEGPDYILIANLVAPDCWDGRNLRSPDGRRHMRYGLQRNSDNEFVCPDGWYQQLGFEVKTEFPAYTFAMRQKMFLSSDRQRQSDGAISTNPADWAPRGSTMHFDWMGGWDRQVFNTWQTQCGGVWINGSTASDFPNGRTCGNSTISQTQRMISGVAPPQAGLSNSPVVVEHDYGAPGTASKDKFGKVISGKVTATIGHMH